MSTRWMRLMLGVAIAAAISFSGAAFAADDDDDHVSTFRAPSVIRVYGRKEVAVPSSLKNDAEGFGKWIKEIYDKYDYLKPRKRKKQTSADTTPPEDGALLPVDTTAALPCDGSKSAAYEPSGRFLYMTGGSGICAYRVDSDTGAVVSVPGTPLATAQFVDGLVVDPTGSYLYAVSKDGNTIEGFAINGDTGALSAVPGSPYPTGPVPRTVTVDATGRFAYTSNNAPNGTISGYAIDRDTGSLTALPGSPFAAIEFPWVIEADTTGKFIYLGGSNTFQVYAIDQATGALTSASTASTVDGPRGIGVDPSGRFVYTTGFAVVRTYAVGPAGTLTQVGEPIAAGNNPLGIAVSRDGRFVYAANLLDGTTSGYRINLADGTLTPIVGSPFDTGDSSYSVATGGGMSDLVVAPLGEAYSNNIAVVGGRPLYQFSVIGGTLPPGLQLGAATGLLAGTPTALGTYDFTAQVKDRDGAISAKDYTVVVVAEGSAIGNGNYQGLWWKSPGGSEAGWGVNFAHQGDIIFATWFTYDANGKPLWLAAVLNKAAEGVYSGDVFTTTGPSFNATAWDGSAVVETTVGNATITFAGDNDATFAYTLNGVQQAKPITRQVFAGSAAACTWGGAPDLALATNYQDLWWKFPANSEPGWGVNFTHQGDIIFFTWFTYDADGKPRWLIAVAQKKGGTDNVYEGPISTVTGPPFGAVPWEPANVVETEVGSTTITFADGNRATFTYTVDGVTQSKEITRQVFAEPGTVCQ